MIEHRQSIESDISWYQLSTHDNKRTMNRMKKELNSLGYEIDMKIYSPIDFGIPQNRKRIFIVGCLKGLEHFSFDSVDVNKNPSIDLNKFISRLIINFVNFLLQLCEFLAKK